MTEHNIDTAVEFTDADVNDLHALGITGDDIPSYHPILRVWREVLRPIDTEAQLKVAPGWASKMVGTTGNTPR